MRESGVYAGIRPLGFVAVVFCGVILAGCPEEFTYYGFNVVYDLAVGPDGSVYVIDLLVDETADISITDGLIHHFTGSGAFICQWSDNWGVFGTGPGDFVLPIAIVAGDDGYVYVADSDTRIHKFTEDGEYVSDLVDPCDGSPLDSGTVSGLALSSNGSIYIADSGFGLIREFTLEGSRVRAWGGIGSDTGEFYGPGGVAVGPDGSVYATDTGNHRIQRFTAKGAFLRAWGEQGSGHGQFLFPDGIAVGPDGSVYVADSGNHRIQRFTVTGAFLQAWGERGSGLGRFDEPSRVAVGSDGSVYVADEQNSRVQQFTADGKFIRAWGKDGQDKHNPEGGVKGRKP